VILEGTSVWERFAGWVANPRGQADAFFLRGYGLMTNVMIS
jgi:hypothetical protein